MSRNLTADLAADLRNRIVDGVIQPGEKLPSENTLINDFGVSRTVVRAALTRLQAEGLVETERGRGSFALTPPTDVPPAVPGGRPVATTEDRLHLLAFRMGVEAEAAALAARNRTDRQLRAVSAALESFTESAGHPAHAMKSDFEFHRAVAAASGNPYYSDCLAALGQTMIAMPRTRLMTGVEHYARDHFDQVVLEHRSIRDAIADGDEAGAAAAMRCHLANSRRRFKASARPSSQEDAARTAGS
ncbi:MULTISPECIES: FadR/GntR family transcriptional regulator [Micrococcaceae]|uniref:FadR/GntR family transcriptional regulator n=1 Tax=Micrococcaceae TaxID=1268 RepID=UPI0006FEE617|nr:MULTISPECIES: FCD domain-containing protein [unclassified Arthrobacter]KRE67014.1 GntR family transcriptional regulator [Arthrobacter sp. Soil761]TWD50413.1 GntR family transcriptional repressor for pyruvate dehydrogenase complex [Arthrobacter sp. AG367]